MICATCHKESSRIRIIEGREICSNCGGFSEANGTRVDGILSRQRVRGEAAKYEGDTINPWQFDKASKKFEPNPDFIKLHPANAHNFYKPEDLVQYPKLAKNLYGKMESQPVTGHEGEYEPRIKEAISEIS